MFKLLAILFFVASLASNAHGAAEYVPHTEAEFEAMYRRDDPNLTESQRQTAQQQLGRCSTRRCD